MNEWIIEEDYNDITLEEVFLAYYKCRKNKKNKLSCLEFDLDYETHLIKLWEEIKFGVYKVSPLSVFIVDKPVKREIFAASFRDRIIHHLIVMKLEVLFEKEFIYDSYSCRVGKGTHFGINRIEKFIRKCSNNYKDECYVLKLDIKGYFMSINKLLLFEKLKSFIKEKYFYFDRKQLLWLCQKIILNDDTKNCVKVVSDNRWIGLPKSKSLFYSKKNCGLPIGNYTNQVFANFYLNSFDHFIKSELNIKYYGRYVDDFILLSNNKVELKKNILKIRNFLKEMLGLELHPKKIYLQNINHGVEFLGSYIKPWRKYITPRIKNNFYLLVNDINTLLDKELLNNNQIKEIQSRLNSYLGILVHSNTFFLRKKLLYKINNNFFNYYSYDFYKVKINKKTK